MTYVDPQVTATTYRITHSTKYTYESPVRVCHNIIMLSPRNDSVVKPINHRIIVSPQPPVMNRREDYFRNQIQTFSLEESHRQLVVTASGRVEVTYPTAPAANTTMPWEEVNASVVNQSDPNWLEACQFRFNSSRIQADEAFAAYARPLFPPGRPILDGAIELMERIYTEFSYDTKATHVHTPTAESFAMRKGVCQDFAHVQIACLRSIGISARYVSGYLRTLPPEGQKKLIGSDESHAWVSVYCGSGTGWVDLDPTNNKLCDADHIPIARGRDYDDVIPIRGVFLGGGKHTITVSVDVAKIE